MGVVLVPAAAVVEGMVLVVTGPLVPDPREEAGLTLVVVVATDAVDPRAGWSTFTAVEVVSGVRTVSPLAFADWVVTPSLTPSPVTVGLAGA